MENSSENKLDQLIQEFGKAEVKSVMGSSFSKSTLSDKDFKFFESILIDDRKKSHDFKQEFSAPISF